ncbi:MAG: bifunctional 4-hydroxy-2-oxoglutarate aldolase/2-dehydro-3-deoxy-phosphogluconate aldolase [Bacillota bacterium]|nr:bifunctional 4-hydroxy-2-oxoglutarate aldolase/2-dehydro-3-deoxy-phosphogluconate aldolase [Bacillota bacterium]
MSRAAEALHASRVVAILRGLGPHEAVAVARALYKGGIRCIEVTYPSPGALESVAAIARELPDVVPGMGTVLTPEEVERSVAAGAEFIVSPHTDPDVIRKTKELGRLAIPGAMTPTEAVTAVRAGADLVKIFPASAVTPAFFREMRGPFPEIRLLGTGGITVENADEFIRAGAYAVGLGGALVAKDLVARGDWDAIAERARTLVEKVQAALR